MFATSFGQKLLRGSLNGIVRYLNNFAVNVECKAQTNVGI